MRFSYFLISCKFTSHLNSFLFHFISLLYICKSEFYLSWQQVFLIKLQLTMYNTLKKEIEASFGEISKIRHCKMLSESILYVTNQRVSESTLWRIFVEPSGIYQPHEYTLDILTFYLGYRDWRDYKYQKQQLRSKKNPQLQLLELCLEDRHVDTVVKFLKTLPDDLSYDYYETVQISGVIGEAVVKDPILRKEVLTKLSTFEQGRIYFSDMFVDEINFNLYYKDVLKLYLKNNVSNQHKNVNDKLFALNILFKHSLFKNQIPKIRSYANVLKNFENDAFVKGNLVHVFPKYRFDNFLIVIDFLENKITANQFVAKMLRLCDTSLSKHKNAFLFRKITAEYLIYFKFYEEAKQLLELAKSEHSFSNCILDEIDDLLIKIPF